MDDMKVANTVVVGVSAVLARCDARPHSSMVCPCDLGQVYRLSVHPYVKAAPHSSGPRPWSCPPPKIIYPEIHQAIARDRQDFPNAGYADRLRLAHRNLSSACVRPGRGSQPPRPPKSSTNTGARASGMLAHCVV